MSKTDIQTDRQADRDRRRERVRDGEKERQRREIHTDGERKTIKETALSRLCIKLLDYVGFASAQSHVSASWMPGCGPPLHCTTPPQERTFLRLLELL